ncbi:hypothetical protein ZWY2020_034812 [Hordeum vulgare]|nr:hypothetical protein ZWY2020_019679 [Hordeum vulgare]KAI4994909.1 hypothetical protein ZWY2020_034812 [Hordeum vulgare]
MSTSCPSCKIGGDSASSLTVSAIVVQAVSGSHVLTVDGYSRTKGLGTGKFIKSGTFDVGGHGWCILYYPDGRASDDADWVSIYLRLDHTDVDVVKAQFNISLVDQHAEPGTPYLRKTQICAFRVAEGPCGFGVIRSKDLEGSVYLKDDVLRIRCDVTVSKEIVTELTAPAVQVTVGHAPPSRPARARMSPSRSAARRFPRTGTCSPLGPPSSGRSSLAR